MLTLIVVLQLVTVFRIGLPDNYLVNTISVDTLIQSYIDSLKKNAQLRKASETFRFNPNFISDYKGYTLGMTPAEIDRLHCFRETGEFINTAEEFQRVTQISDSLLQVLAPNFKFPNWVLNAKKDIKPKQASFARTKMSVASISVANINTADAEALAQVPGIGEVLSKRIVKFRNALGGFLVNEQLYDVFGLKPEVATRLLQHYQVLKAPEIQKVNLNEASAKELAKLIYISYEMAQEIVAYRKENGKFKAFDELKDVHGFPFEKIDRIVLYLLL